MIDVGGLEIRVCRLDLRRWKRHESKHKHDRDNGRCNERQCLEEHFVSFPQSPAAASVAVTSRHTQVEVNIAAPTTVDRFENPPKTAKVTVNDRLPHKPKGCTMKTEGRRESENVEDRRGQGGRMPMGRAGVGGLGLIIIVICR